MSKIKVAIMSHELDVRPERTLYFRRLIEGLLEKDEFDLTLVHFEKMPDDPLYTRTREVLIPRVRSPFASRFFSFIRYCLTTRDTYDIVHWFKPRIFPFFWLFPARHTTVMAHGGGEVFVEGIWTMSRRIFVYTVQWFQKYIDVMIAVSEYANKEIVDAYHFPPEKVITIYNAVDPIYLAPPNERFETGVRREYGINGASYFFSVSRFRLHKNIGRIVHAYVEYRSKNSASDELLVLGGGTIKEFEEVYGKLPDSPFVKDIRFLGYIPVDHMPALYRGAQALIFVSLNEGFGLPIVEAMACGTPVVVSSVASLPEIAGDAGIVVDPNDTSALATALSELRDPDRRKTMMERGLVRSQFFTWEKTVQKTIDLFQAVAKPKIQS